MVSYVRKQLHPPIVQHQLWEPQALQSDPRIQFCPLMGQHNIYDLASPTSGYQPQDLLDPQFHLQVASTSPRTPGFYR